MDVGGVAPRVLTNFMCHPQSTPRADRPLEDRAALSAVRAPALIVGQAGDPLHLLSLAGELAAALPNATLLELPAGGVFWTATRSVQDALAAHLSVAVPPSPETLLPETR